APSLSVAVVVVRSIDLKIGLLATSALARSTAFVQLGNDRAVTSCDQSTSSARILSGWPFRQAHVLQNPSMSASRCFFSSSSSSRRSPIVTELMTNNGACLLWPAGFGPQRAGCRSADTAKPHSIASCRRSTASGPQARPCGRGAAAARDAVVYRGRSEDYLGRARLPG